MTHPTPHDAAAPAPSAGPPSTLVTQVPPEIASSGSFVAIDGGSPSRHALAEEAPRAATPDLVPARTLNEFVYCPRLGYLMWADAEWADSHDTAEGRYAHRRVDQATGAVPSADEASRRGVVLRTAASGWNLRRHSHARTTAAVLPHPVGTSNRSGKDSDAASEHWYGNGLADPPSAVVKNSSNERKFIVPPYSGKTGSIKRLLVWPSASPEPATTCVAFRPPLSIGHPSPPDRPPTIFRNSVK